jgi:hypothetical protein
MSEGNWRWQVSWDKKDGQPPAAADKGYKEEGLLHVCPYADDEGGTTNIEGKYFDVAGSYKLENATCEQAGEGRFKVKAQWTVPGGGKTFHLGGDARIIDQDTGPTFIYGKITSEGGADSGSWEAVRRGRPAGSGPGEDGKGAVHDGSAPPE